MVLSAALGTALVGPAALANGALEFSADAAVVKAEITLLSGLILNPLTINVVHAGPIPFFGGYDTDNLASIGPGTLQQLLLKGVVAEASAAGGALSPAGLGKSHGFASVASANVGLGPVSPTALTLSADVIQSASDAVCDQTTRVASISGASVIANLAINGHPIVVDGKPNQTIMLPGLASVIINEQVSELGSVPVSTSYVTDKGTMTVNAIHVSLLNPLDRLLATDLIIGHSHADITCQKRKV